MFPDPTNVFAVLPTFMADGQPVALHQKAHEVRIRDPKVGRYGTPAPAADTATEHWEYAAMSANAYQEGRVAVATGQTVFSRSLDYTHELSEEAFAAAFNDENAAIPLAGWRKWDFPSPTLQKRMLKEGMYLEVLEREEPHHCIVVVFEGTNFTQLRDWKANLRWFFRFVPGYRDQYTLAAREVAAEFHEVLGRRMSDDGFTCADGQLTSPSGAPVKIVSTGHSLGGGLAQHFAYVVKQEDAAAGPKVAEVYAFDPSPVTGWFTAPDPPRTYNAQGLRINRLFEHGEILAYLRLFTSRLAVTKENPAIWEYRYNFEKNANVVASHGMRQLAYGLIQAAKPWETDS